MSAAHEVRHWDTPRPARAITDRIEQAIARGWTNDQIRAELGVTREQIAAVWRAMEAAVTE